MAGKSTSAANDPHIPRPVWFAQQLRWCTGPQPIWSWNRLLDEAERRYWTAKAERIGDAA